MSRGVLKRYNNQKMENLYNLHAWYEIKLLIFMGVILYGLCQYNQVNLAWIFLLFPIIYLVFKNTFIFGFVSMAHQNAPREIKPTFAVSQQAQQTILQEAQNQQNRLQSPTPTMPVNKDLNLTGYNPPLNNLSTF